MIQRILVAVACSLGVGPGTAATQQAALRPRPSALFVVPAPAADTLRLAPTYWKEGALIGGIPMAILGAIAGHGLCEWADESGNDNCVLAAVGTGVLSGGVGAIVGALIGAQFHKQE